MEISLILIVKLLVGGLLVTFLWLQLLRVTVWMMIRVIEWATDNGAGKKRGLIRFLRRLLLDPL